MILWVNDLYKRHQAYKLNYKIWCIKIRNRTFKCRNKKILLLNN
jgi:hypothetical protein